MRGRLLIVAAVVAGLCVGAGIVAAAGVFANEAAYQGPVTLSGPGGDPNVTLTGSGRVALSDFVAGPDELQIDTNGGNVTVNGTGTIELTSIGGTWTNVTGMDVDGDSTTIDPEDKGSVEVAGKTDTLNYTDIDKTSLNDGETDFVYSGASGDTSLTFTTPLPNGTLVKAVDNSGTVLDSDTVDSDGSLTYILSNSKHNVSLSTKNASDFAPLFQNTTSPDTGNWTNGSRNASLDTLADYMGRLPGLTLGGSGGLGAAGAFVFGLLVFGLVTVGTSAAAAGPTMGAVAGATSMGVLTALGLAPEWLYVVVLFVLGSVGAAVVIRAWS